MDMCPAVLRMNLTGANLQPEMEALEPLEGKANYFLGADPTRWRTNIQTYARIRYGEVYPGIDLVYYGQQGQLEFDFIVHPGASSEAIRLRFDGADGLRLDEAGGLVVQLQGKSVRWPKPLIYQWLDGTKKEIQGAYILNTPEEAGFELTNYDPTIPLIIDPVLVYSSYLGGNDLDAAEAMAVDSSGNVYLTGETLSLNFPTASAYQSSSAGSNDVIVTKFNPSGSGLIYSTYLGGSGDEFGMGIAVDASGNAYVTGMTDSPNFPTHNAYQSSRGSSSASDAFVFKLGPAGSTLLYSSYFGGPGIETGNGIAVDGSGNAYLTGGTSSGSQFPKASPFQNNAGAGLDAYVAKFNPVASGGASLIYSSWLGGGDEEQGNAITVDPSGNAYVAGEVFSLDTVSSTFPVVNALQPLYAGGDVDVFVAKINAAGSSVLWATFLGGEDDDSGFDITLDSANNVYVTGETRSSFFPVTYNAQQPVIGGGGDFFSKDAFVSKIQANGASLLYSTYLGGSEDESGAGVAVDGSGAIYLTGWTESSFDFPVTTGADQYFFGDGPSDAFAVKLNPAAPGPSGLVYSSYFGGSGLDQGTGIGLDADGNFYICGFSDSTDLFTTAGAHRTSFAGGTYDAFVAKFASPADLSVSILPSTNPVLVGNNLTYTLTVNNNWRTTFTGVFLTNYLPTGVTFVSMTNNHGACVRSGGTITCNLGTMTNNDSAMLTVVVKTQTPGDIFAEATLVADQAEINTDNNNPTQITTVRGIANLALGQVDAPDPVIVTSNLTYSISVTNLGPWPATQILLTNVFSPNVNFITANQSQGDYFEIDTNVLLFELSDGLAVGESATVSVTVAPFLPGVITNQIGVSGFELDTNQANNISSISTTVNPLANLTLSSDVSPDTIYVGDDVTYTLVISNQGPSTATGIVFTNHIPAGSTYVSSQAIRGSCTRNGSIVTCTLNNLAQGASTTVTIVANATADGSLTNISNVSADALDPIPADNTVINVNTASPLADLALTISDAPDPVILSSNLIYTLLVTNRGPSGAENVTLSDTLPPGVSFLSVIASQGSCSPSGSSVNCSLGTISSGGSVQVTITVGTTSSGSATNLATVMTSTADPNLANNSGLTVTRINSRPTISNIADQTINEDGTAGPISFTIGDLETPAANLKLAASSSNPGLVSNGSFTFGGGGANRNLSILPLADQFGSATITVQVTDADGGSAGASFLLTVNPVNDPPTLNPIGNLNLLVNAAQQRVSLGGISSGPANEAGQVLTVSAVSSNPSLVPNPTVTYLSPNPTGTVAVAISPNMTGTAMVTVTVQDNGGTANGGQNSFSRQFTVDVSDIPSLQITRNNNVVVLSWPTNATGFHLQTRAGLSDPTTWTQVSTNPKVSGDRNYYTNNLNDPYFFFRLSNP